MKNLILLLTVLTLFSCSDDDKNTICVSFDKRQCMGDPWSSDVDSNADADVQSDQISEYFKSLNIEVENVKVDLDFHQIVCEACFVCPEGPRFFVEAEEAEILKIEALELLNYNFTDCSEL